MQNAITLHLMRSVVLSMAVASLAILLLVTLCSCGQTDNTSDTAVSTGEQSESHRIIIDTDAGADDASAIILAARCPNVTIEGVTVVVGNVDVDQAAKNALMALEVAGSDAPVYRGSSDTFDGKQREPFSVFGTDGMGDQGLVHPSGQAANGDAVDYILNTVRNNPGEIEIVSIGPATNIAKAIDRDPETMSHVKMVWSMGTGGLGPGNASPVAEFNVYHDVSAYKVLIESKIPITVVGLDMCNGQSFWTDEMFDKLEHTNEIGAFVAKSFTKLRDYYRETGRGGAVDNCDALTMTCALFPNFITGTKQCAASCITEPGQTYAQVIFYQEGLTYDTAEDIISGLSYDVTLVTNVNRKSFFERYKDKIAALGQQ